MVAGKHAAAYALQERSGRRSDCTPEKGCQCECTKQGTDPLTHSQNKKNNSLFFVFCG